MAAQVAISENDGKSAKGKVRNGTRQISWIAARSSRTKDCWNVTLLGNLNGVSGPRRQALQAMVAKGL